MDQDTAAARVLAERGAVGAPVVARIRRLLVIAGVSALVYGVLTTASSSSCRGGISADGGFVDEAGSPVDAVPQCVQLDLGPSGIVLAAIAIVILLALGRVIRRALDAGDAFRILDRAAIAIVVLAAGSAVVAQVWFWTIGTVAGPAGFSIVAPVPFATIDVDIAPMPAP